jgi:hypothetical protein
MGQRKYVNISILTRSCSVIWCWFLLSWLLDIEFCWDVALIPSTNKTHKRISTTKDKLANNADLMLSFIEFWSKMTKFIAAARNFRKTMRWNFRVWYEQVRLCIVWCIEIWRKEAARNRFSTRSCQPDVSCWNSEKFGGYSYLLLLGIVLHTNNLHGSDTEEIVFCKMRATEKRFPFGTNTTEQNQLSYVLYFTNIRCSVPMYLMVFKKILRIYFELIARMVSKVIQTIRAGHYFIATTRCESSFLGLTWNRCKEWRYKVNLKAYNTIDDIIIRWLLEAWSHWICSLCPHPLSFADSSF